MPSQLNLTEMDSQSQDSLRLNFTRFKGSGLHLILVLLPWPDNAILAHLDVTGIEQLVYEVVRLLVDLGLLLGGLELLLKAFEVSQLVVESLRLNLRLGLLV